MYIYKHSNNLTMETCFDINYLHSASSTLHTPYPTPHTFSPPHPTHHFFSPLTVSCNSCRHRRHRPLQAFPKSSEEGQALYSFSVSATYAAGCYAQGSRGQRKVLCLRWISYWILVIELTPHKIRYFYYMIKRKKMHQTHYIAHLYTYICIYTYICVYFRVFDK